MISKSILFIQYFDAVTFPKVITTHLIMKYLIAIYLPIVKIN